MIDDELAGLFRSAASDAGAPPAFDHADVVRASRRITARRRAVVTGALGLLAFVGIGAAVVLPRSEEAASTAAAPFAVSGDDSGRTAAPEAALPATASGQAADAVAPLGPDTGRCADRQDPALRAVVEQVLPEVIGAPAAATTNECRPGGERGVSVEADDGAAAGLLTVGYLPPGTTVQPVPDAVSVPTASGGTVVVSSRPDMPGGAAPFADRLGTVTAFLAPRL